MHPGLLLLLAVLTPVALCVTLVVPAYASLFGAAYIIYMPAAGGPHPLAERWHDVLYIIDVYSKLFSYWLEHTDSVSFVGYTLPVIGLPLLGVCLSLWLTYKLASKLLNLFHLSASVT